MWSVRGVGSDAESIVWSRSSGIFAAGHVGHGGAPSQFISCREFEDVAVCAVSTTKMTAARESVVCKYFSLLYSPI